MKRKLLMAAIGLITSLLAPPISAEIVEVTDTNFPDANFRKYLADKLNSDNGDSAPYTAPGTIDEPGTIDTDKVVTLHCENYGIKTLKGVERFTKLVYFGCSGNHLLSVPFPKSAWASDFGTQEVHTNLKAETIDLKTIDSDFDPSKVTEGSVSGGSLSSDGKFTFNADTYKAEMTVLYTIGTDNNKQMKIVLRRNFPVTEDFFPDANFRDYLTKKLNDNNDDRKPYNASDISINPQELQVISCQNYGIESLKGIELFYELGRLYCDGNHLISVIPPSKVWDPNFGTQTIDTNLKAQTIDLKALDSDFDPSKVKQENVSGGSLSSDGKFTFNADTYKAEITVYPIETKTEKPMKIVLRRNIPVAEDIFPDAKFRDYLTTKLNDNNDDRAPYNASDISVNPQKLQVISCQDYGIESLKGIEFFYNLGRLYCGGNHLLSVNYPVCVWDADFGTQKLEGTEKKPFDKPFSLTELDSNFDPTKVLPENVEGGTLTNDGTFTFDRGEFHAKITYYYTVSGNQKPIVIELQRYADKLDISVFDTNWPLKRYLMSLGDKYYDANTKKISLGIGKMELDWQYNDLTSLEGIEKFQNLMVLNINNRKVGESLKNVDLPKSLVHLYCANVEGLTGIKNLSELTNLETLYIANNVELETLDVSNNTNLKKLSCGSDLENGSKLKSLTLPTDPSKLEELDCSRVPMTSLDLKNCSGLKFLNMIMADGMADLKLPDDPSKIQKITVDRCALKTLDLTNCTSLRRLECTNNLLTSLDLRYCTALDTLACGNPFDFKGNGPGTEGYRMNDFKRAELDLSHNKTLKWLDCMHLNISKIDLSEHHDLEYINCGLNSPLETDNPEFDMILPTKADNLHTLNCGSNRLTDGKLNVTIYSALKILECAENQLTHLDITQNKELTYLYARQNKLTEMNVQNNPKLHHLTCSYNPINTLDVSNNPLLTSLNCNDNGLTKLDLSNNTLLDTLHVENNQLIALDLTKQTKLFDVKVNNQNRNLGTGRHFNMGRRDDKYDGTNVQDVKDAMFSKDFTDYVIDTTEDDVNFEDPDAPVTDPTGQENPTDGTEPDAGDPVEPDNNSALEDWLTFDEQQVKATYNYRTGGVFNDDPTEKQTKSAPRRAINRSEPEIYTGKDGTKYALMDVTITRDGVTTGIAAVTAGRDAASVRVEQGAAVIEGAEGRISVYTTAGMLAATATATAGYPTRIPLATGLYMVVTPANTAKIYVP